MAKPEWLKIKAQSSPELEKVEKLIRDLSLNTVCDEAACPNRLECFGRRTATFMILGKTCTRNCAFCNVENVEDQAARCGTDKLDLEARCGTSKLGDAVDPQEPQNIVKAVEILGLKHVVITSVTRDDLDDGGSTQFGAVIQELKKSDKARAGQGHGNALTVEVLIPDFGGNTAALQRVVAAQPDIIGHNVETVPRLYPIVRANADYQRSLNLLKNVKAMGPKIFTKSSIMLGLGETHDEVLAVFADLRNINCDFLCVGQYLSPTKKHHPVLEYIAPAEFDTYKRIALEMGFTFVASAPFVRSSYHADEAMGAKNLKIR